MSYIYIHAHSKHAQILANKFNIRVQQKQKHLSSLEASATSNPNNYL